MYTTIKIRFRVITPSSWSDITGFHTEGKNKGEYKEIETLEEAKKALDQWGTPQGGKESEHYEYWQDQKKLCKIVRETTIVEEDINSEIDFLEETIRSFKNDATFFASFSGTPRREMKSQLFKATYDTRVEEVLEQRKEWDNG